MNFKARTLKILWRQRQWTKRFRRCYDYIGEIKYSTMYYVASPFPGLVSLFQWWYEANVYTENRANRRSNDLKNMPTQMSVWIEMERNINKKSYGFYILKWFRCLFSFHPLRFSKPRRNAKWMRSRTSWGSNKQQQITLHNCLSLMVVKQGKFIQKNLFAFDDWSSLWRLASG